MQNLFGVTAQTFRNLPGPRPGLTGTPTHYKFSVNAVLSTPYVLKLCTRLMIAVNLESYPEMRHDVDVHGSNDVLVRRVQELPSAHSASVVDENIDIAHFGLHLRNRKSDKNRLKRYSMSQQGKYC